MTKTFTKKEVEMLYEILEIDYLLENGEEKELLKANNPELYKLYQKLKSMRK